MPQLKKDDSVTAYHLKDENSVAEKEDVTADASAGTATLESGKFSIHALLLGSAINTATVVIDYDKNTDIHSVTDSGGNRIILYCMNNGLHWPHTTPTISSVPAYSEITFDEFCKQNGITDSAKISNIEEQLKTILYAGYPYNGLSLYQINTGTATSISESEFNQMLIPPDVLRTDFPDSIGQNAFTYSSEYLDNSSEKYQLLNKFMQEELALYFSGGSTQSGLTSQQIRALPFYKAVNSLLNNPNDPFTTYAQFYGEGYFLTDSQAYANTSNAVWTLMDNNGVPNNNPVTQTDLSTSLLTASGTNILSAEPSNSEAAITGDTTFHRNSTDGKWYTGTMTLTAPDSWKQTFELTLPKGITTTNGQSQIQIGESFVLVSEKEPTQEETVTVSATIPWMDGKLRVYEPATTAAAADGKGFQNMVGAVIKKTQISLSAKLNTAITISGTKTWDDGNNQDGKRPKSITVKLLANNVEKAQTTVEADNKGNWTYSFENLPKYEDGKEVAYTVTEDKVDGYTTSYRGYNITNSYTPGKISVIVAKAWDDQNNQDGKRPGSVQVQLYADKKASGVPVTLTEAGKWMYTWEGLDEMSAGKKIEYTVKEVNVPEGYTSSVNENSTNSFIITNSHTPETVSVSGRKIWDDKDNQDGKRPESITIHLMANGVQKDSMVVKADADGNWTYSFTDLPKYENGTEIIYTVTEDKVDGYTTSHSGYNITNSYTPGKTSVTVTKAWEDQNNQDGKRPGSVQVQLYADKKAAGDPVTLTEAGKWMYTWEGLDEMSAGKKIEYTVKEVNVPEGYTSSVNENSANSFIITNSHTPETVSVSGRKIWDDKDNQDGKRPKSITIHLMANGVQKDSVVVKADADGNWTYSFTDLPKYENGTEIIYTVTEDKVDGYTTSHSGYNITNSYTPGKTSVTVTKAWEDQNNQDGKRPGSVQVQLYADKKAAGDPVTLTEAGKWMHTWESLDEMSAGKKIEYTVKEVNVPEGYDQSVNENSANSFIITNSHTPETVSVSGRKIWDDKDNQDGKRPKSITIHLMANGVQKDNVVVKADADGNWTYSFTDLPKYENGTEIIYTVTEDKVDGYTTSHSGYNITNSYTPGKTSVTVTKAWEDQNNQDGKRPGSVQVQLYADKKAAGDPVTLTEAGKWMHTWESLDEMSAGKKIEYTVKEVNVPEGYDQSVNENSANSFIITNSHTPETTSVSGTKMWEDGNDKDGIRPDSVQVQLLANGKTVGDAVTLNEANQWKNTWTNLPKYANGKEIVYSVEEVEVPSGYSVSYSGNVQEGFVVTNKHTPEKTSPTTTPPTTPTDTPTTTPTATPTDTPTATPTTIPAGTPTATPSSTPGAPAVPRTPGGNNTNNRNTNQTTGDNSSKVSTGKVSTGRVATGDDTNNRIWQISMIVSSALLVLFVIMVILNRKRDK